MFKGHLRELSKSFGNQICPEKSQELRRTKTGAHSSFKTAKVNMFELKVHMKFFCLEPI
jgi:hypothetical protein